MRVRRTRVSPCSADSTLFRADTVALPPVWGAPAWGAFRIGGTDVVLSDKSRGSAQRGESITHLLETSRA
jgi:hypothetical protein